MESKCLACEARAGRLRLTPAPEIYSGVHWIIEHIHPTSILGWVVLATRTHRRALHDLTEEEWDEANRLLPVLIQAVRRVTDAEKEYLVQFAEKEGFEHVHFHVIPRAREWRDELRGPGVFSYGMGASVSDPVSEQDMTSMAERLRTEIAKML